MFQLCSLLMQKSFKTSAVLKPPTSSPRRRITLELTAVKALRVISTMPSQKLRSTPGNTYKRFIKKKKNNSFFWRMSCDLVLYLASLRSNRLAKPSAPSNPPYQKVYLFCPSIENLFFKTPQRSRQKGKRVTKLASGGEPSTWFPPGTLVELSPILQAHSCIENYLKRWQTIQENLQYYPRSSEGHKKTRMNSSLTGFRR